MTPAAQRVVGIVVLLVLGMLTLPASATILDGRGTENWIVPVAVVAMMAFGAAVTVALPGLASAGASTGRRAITGLWWGLVACFAGVLVFWFLLNGLSGA